MRNPGDVPARTRMAQVIRQSVMRSQRRITDADQHEQRTMKQVSRIAAIGPGFRSSFTAHSSLPALGLCARHQLSLKRTSIKLNAAASTRNKTWM